MSNIYICFSICWMTVNSKLECAVVPAATLKCTWGKILSLILSLIFFLSEWLKLLKHDNNSFYCLPAFTASFYCLSAFMVYFHQLKHTENHSLQSSPHAHVWMSVDASEILCEFAFWGERKNLLFDYPLHACCLWI